MLLGQHLPHLVGRLDVRFRLPVLAHTEIHPQGHDLQHHEHHHRAKSLEPRIMKQPQPKHHHPRAGHQQQPRLEPLPQGKIQVPVPDHIKFSCGNGCGRPEQQLHHHEPVTRKPSLTPGFMGADPGNLISRGVSYKMGEALCGFAWDATPQGGRYWQEIFEKARGGEFEENR